MLHAIIAHDARECVCAYIGGKLGRDTEDAGENITLNFKKI